MTADDRATEAAVIGLVLVILALLLIMTKNSLRRPEWKAGL